MKHTIVTKFLRSLAAIVTISSLPMAAHGTGSIIVQDNFNRNGTLVGSNADTGQTWGGSSTYSTFDSGFGGPFYQVDGDTASFASINGLSFLPNSTYCLSVDMTIFLPISNGWLGVGFSQPTATGISTGTVGAFQLTQVADVRSHVVNLTSQQIDPVGSDPFFTTQNLQVILQTGATLVSSTLTWEVDNVAVRSGVPVDASGIDGIFLAHESSDNLFRGRFERLQLLGPIPETSSMMLLALGELGALVRRKR